MEPSGPGEVYSVTKKINNSGLKRRIALRISGVNYKSTEYLYVTLQVRHSILNVLSVGANWPESGELSLGS